MLVYRDSDKQSLPWSVFSCGIGGPAQRLCRGSRLLSVTLCVSFCVCVFSRFFNFLIADNISFSMYIRCVILYLSLQRLEPQGRRFTNFRYDYYIHRDRRLIRDRIPAGQDGHLDFHTAPELRGQ